MSGSPEPLGLLVEIIRAAIRDEVAAGTEHVLEEERALLSPLKDVPTRSLLTIKEVAEFMGVGVATVRSWVTSGELVPVDLSGKRLLIPKEQILDLIEKAGAKRRNCGDAPND